MGGHGGGFQAWFFPAYIGFFVLVVLVAIALVVAVFRRPLDRFPGSWPAARLRWSLIPVLVLVLLGIQLVLVGLATLPDKSLFLTARARIAPMAGALGLATALFSLATLAEGVVYLLRLAFPSQRRRDVIGAGSAHADEDGGAAADDQAGDVSDGSEAGPPE